MVAVKHFGPFAGWDVRDRLCMGTSSIVSHLKDVIHIPQIKGDKESPRAFVESRLSIIS